MPGTRKNRRSTEGTNAHAVDVARADKRPNADLIGETVALWQPLTTRPLTREDGREIIENMTGFLRVLQEWRRAERAGGSGSQGSKDPTDSSRSSGQLERVGDEKAADSSA